MAEDLDQPTSPEPDAEAAPRYRPEEAASNWPTDAVTASGWVDDDAETTNWPDDEPADAEPDAATEAANWVDTPEIAIDVEGTAAEPEAAPEPAAEVEVDAQRSPMPNQSLNRNPRWQRCQTWQ
ncbi:MAG: hypothetical protein HC838_09745 [Spirulinaceae cyanobacterium RM2_2_10]|nr:hypothetical protein [Spirulinaceae cyanobacterium RM2_2_10]